MRYLIDFYSDKDYPLLKELASSDPSNFNVPSIDYLRDVALCIRDLQDNKLVGFVCAVVGLSNTAYVSHLFLYPKLRKTKLGRVLLLKLINRLDEILHGRMKKQAYELFVDEKNINAINFHKRFIRAKMLGKGYLFRKEFNDVAND
jgi:GNAT superfamily N-acetyltransferase